MENIEERLKKFDGFLTSGAYVEDGSAGYAYRAAQKELYKMFPELGKIPKNDKFRRFMNASIIDDRTGEEYAGAYIRESINGDGYFARFHVKGAFITEETYLSILEGNKVTIHI